MSTQRNIQLLLIDPQNDLRHPGHRVAHRPGQRRRRTACTHCPPGAAGAGADADMKRLAAFIDRVGPSLTDIHVTLDSHNPVDIAHPAWWRNANGDPPPPFTVINSADIAGGLWQARDPRFQDHSRRYVDALNGEDATSSSSGRNTA